MIKDAEFAGFSASIYRNTSTGDVAVSYRGTRGTNLNDWATNALLRGGNSRPGAAPAAADLAKFVQQDYPNSRVTLTGHSLGGYWAMYASMQSGIASVYVFNPARGPGLSSYHNPSQITTVVSGELVGDPTTGSHLFGSGTPPGKLYGVDSSRGSPGVFGDIGSHNLQGMIWGLTGQALKLPAQSNNGTASSPRDLANATSPDSNHSKPAATSASSSFDRSAPEQPSRQSSAGILPQRTDSAPSLGPKPSPPLSKRTADDGDDGYGSNFLRGVVNDPSRSLSDRQKAAQALHASPSDRQLAAMNLGWDPTGLVRGSQHGASLPKGAQSSNSPAAQAQPNTQLVARAPAPNAIVSAPPANPTPPGTATGFRPISGGISLSRAAADRMPLEIALDASALADGNIVLSGRASKTQMDAALFLTALRAACDDRDLYFSLDPDDGSLWSQQGEQASHDFWKKIKQDFASDAPPSRAKSAQSSINIRTVSATQDYPRIWRDISPHYPNFRAKLVFHPEWLRQTRLGEVLYKADVLLKELSSGVSVLVPGKLRASAIPGYLSADIEYAAKGLLADTRDQSAGRPQWRGSRLWFEITPSELPTTVVNEATPSPSSYNHEVRSLLQSKGLIRPAYQAVHKASFFVRHGSVFDLSHVNPIMFVRVHDHATKKDLSDHDPRLDGLAADVSTRFDQYAQHYDELKLLRDVFRAYIAARKITEANDHLCGTLYAMPLLDSEKLGAPLPDYHSSELFVTIATSSTMSRKGSQTQFVKASSMSGGVSIAGQKFVETAMRDGETTVTRAVEAVLAGVNLDQPDAIDSDRRFISFIVDDGSGTAVRLASNVNGPLAPRSLSDYPIENEPGAAVSPFGGQGGKGAEWSNSIGTLFALMAVGLLVNYVARKRRISGS